jgi:hypothetical protein
MNFKFPQLWRSNIAIDQRLPWGLIGTAEYMYSKDVNGMAYINANLPAARSSFAGPDGRPLAVRCRRSPPTTNPRASRERERCDGVDEPGQGSSWNAAATLRRSFTNGLYAKVGYSYGVSKNTVDRLDRVGLIHRQLHRRRPEQSDRCVLTVQSGPARVRRGHVHA